MDKIFPIAPERLDGADLLPVAALRRPVAWFENLGIAFVEEFDDLDWFQFASLSVRSMEETLDRRTRGLAEQQAPFTAGRSRRDPFFWEVQGPMTEPDTDFALRRYRGAPPDTVDVLLSHAERGTLRTNRAVERIAAALGVPEDAILWPADRLQSG